MRYRKFNKLRDLIRTFATCSKIAIAIEISRNSELRSRLTLNFKGHYRYSTERYNMHFSLRVISFAWYKKRGLCQIGLYYEVYYRHLAHLSDRLGSLEVAISLIRKINYRPASGLDYFGHSFDPQPLLLKYRRRSRVNRFQLVILPHFLEKYHP